MKNIVKLLGVCACGCLALTSCDNDKFLNVDQYDRVPGDYMWQNDETAKMGMNAIYKMNNPMDGYDGDWGFKPNLFSGTHPTMDTQAGGWDANFTKQAWNAQTTELNDGWKHAYHAIGLANDYLTQLEKNKGNLSERVATSLEGEAYAMHGFFYHYLATTWGRVPLLKPGESFLTDPEKPKAETYEEMWDLLIEDFTKAAELLTWEPLDGQKGRATKGMALAYLGDCYMWKAYRCPDKAKECYAEAIKAFRQIMEQVNAGKIYKLQDCYSTNWDPEGTWNDETIWVEVLNDCFDWSGWDDDTSRSMTKWFCACTENGGWGSLYLSWEWYASYEFGDKRRDASCVIGEIPANDLKKLYQYANKENAEALDRGEMPVNWGVHPYLKEYIGNKGATSHFRFGGETLPSCWTNKFWRNASANDGIGRNSWGYAVWSPANVYWKRLPNVMLDLAECLFRTEGEGCQEAWDLIDKLRDRAFGNKEVGKNGNAYMNHIQQTVRHYMDANAGDPAWQITNGQGVTEYPLPYNTQTVTVRKAKDYYTEYAKCNIKGKAFSLPVWQVAVNEERRKEFGTEWCLRPDLQKSGYLAEHIAVNYPKYVNQGVDDPWSNREYEYNDQKMDMPIPADELDKNPLCEQNPAYLTEE